MYYTIITLALFFMNYSNRARGVRNNLLCSVRLKWFTVSPVKMRFFVDPQSPLAFIEACFKVDEK